MSPSKCPRCDSTGINRGGRRCGLCGGDGREAHPVEGSQSEETCECGMPHLGGTEHADECPVGMLKNNPWLARLDAALGGSQAKASK